MERRAIRIFYKEKEEDKKWNYHYDSKNKTTTVGDVKRAFAAMNGFYEDRIRFLFKDTRTVLDDSSLITEYENEWDKHSNPSSSDSDSDKDAQGAGAEEDDNKDADQKEKGELDESEKEKSKLLMKLFNDFHSKLSQQPNYEKRKLGKRNQKELQSEIITVMRMHRKEPEEPLEAEERPEPAFVLDFYVEETSTLAVITANEDVKYLPFLETDTLEETRIRCSKLFNMDSPEFLELRIREDSNLFTEAANGQRLGELGVRDKGSLFASRKGRHKIRTLFGLCACMDIEANMEKTARSFRRKIVTIAPDLLYVNFFMWYNGKFLSIEKKGPPLGDVIMGSSLLRVVIEMDLSLAHDIDTGPDLKRRSDEEEARRRREEAKDKPRNLSGSSSDKSENSQEKSVKPGERLWFDVNKRALRNFDLVVECHQLKPLHKDNDGKEYEFDNEAEYEAPISLTKLTYRMLFYDLRKKIAYECGENKTHQILYRNGERFTSRDDSKTLRDLELTPDGDIVKTIYKEPSVVVWVEYRDEKISMKVAGNGTSFGHLARLLVDEKKVPLTHDKIAFEHKDLVVSKDVLFSECKVKNGDIIKLVETFKVRVWQNMYIYDKEFWPHSHISEFKNWIEKETEITEKKQVFVKIEDDSIVKLGDSPTSSMKDCGFPEIGEIEIFKEGELPEHLQKKEEGSAVAGATAAEDDDGALDAECVDSEDDEDDDE